MKILQLFSFICILILISGCPSKVVKVEIYPPDVVLVQKSIDQLPLPFSSFKNHNIRILNSDLGRQGVESHQSVIYLIEDGLTDLILENGGTVANRFDSTIGDLLNENGDMYTVHRDLRPNESTRVYETNFSPATLILIYRIIDCGISIDVAGDDDTRGLMKRTAVTRLAVRIESVKDGSVIWAGTVKGETDDLIKVKDPEVGAYFDFLHYNQ